MRPKKKKFSLFLGPTAQWGGDLKFGGVWFGCPLVNHSGNSPDIVTQNLVGTYAATATNTSIKSCVTQNLPKGLKISRIEYHNLICKLGTWNIYAPTWGESVGLFTGWLYADVVIEFKIS